MRNLTKHFLVENTYTYTHHKVKIKTRQYTTSFTRSAHR